MFVRDLEYINIVLDLLREKLQVNEDSYLPVLESVLQMCSKVRCNNSNFRFVYFCFCQPLFEVKTNERLRPQSKTFISSFFVAIASFWSASNRIEVTSTVANCFRCIINNGRDPTHLQADHVEWIGDGSKLQIIDKPLIYSIIRECKVLDILVSKYLNTVKFYIVAKEDFDLAIASQHERSQDVGDDLTPYQHDNEDFLELKTKVRQYYNTIDAVLDLCLEMSYDNKIAAEFARMGLCKGAIIMLDQIIKEEGCRHARVTDVIQLLWLCLENLKEAAAWSHQSQVTDEESNVLDFEFVVVALQFALNSLISDGYRLVDKECRNEVVIVLSLVWTLYHDHVTSYFVVTGLVDNLVTYACIGETSNDAWLYFDPVNPKTRNFVSVDLVDMQFKRLLWSLLSEIMSTDDKDVLSCIASSPLLEVLLQYLEQDSSEKDEFPSTQISLMPSQHSPSVIVPGVSFVDDSSFRGEDHILSPSTIAAQSKSVQGTVVDVSKSFQTAFTSSKSFLQSMPISQLRRLQVIASLFLVSNASKVLGEFLRIGGHRRLFVVIEKYYQSSVLDHKQVIYHNLLTLNHCVSLVDTEYIVKVFQDIDVLGKLFMLYDYYHDVKDENDINIQCVRLISLFCTNNVTYQQAIPSGLLFMIKSLQQYSSSRKPSVGVKARVITSDILSQPPDDLAHDLDSLVVSIIDCFRVAIVGNVSNEYALALNEGVDAILNLLEVSSFALRIQVFRLLSDLLENKKLLLFLHAWRSSKTLRSAAQLVCHSWLDEEFRLRGMRENGIIANLWDALGSQTWPSDISIDYTTESVSLSSVSEDVKSFVATRLNEAIAASKTLGGRDFEASMLSEINELALRVDSRGVISNILYLMDVFDLPTDVLPELMSEENKSDLKPTSLKDLGLSFKERQVLALAKRYSILRAGEWWDQVVDDLNVSTTIPIEADQAMVDSYKEEVFKASLATQMEQMIVHEDFLGSEASKDSTFQDYILNKKEQQIRGEWLKKHAKYKLKVNQFNKLNND